MQSNAANIRSILLFCLAGSLVLASNCPTGSLAAREIDFINDIRPILSEKCFHCHGPDAAHRQADLRLDVEASIKRDRGGYAVVDVSHPDESVLLQRITSQDPSQRMPPAESDKTLSPADIQHLQLWVQQGSAWSDHWAYRLPEKYRPPSVAEVSWPANWIDRFILAAIEENHLSPSPNADLVTLCRRLHFDLTGLPPTPAVIDTFVANFNDQTYTELVDRLLASPHFGERMAVYWLDLVRYADSVGYHGDQEHSISPYRDWVIEALNSNMAFDEFTRQQLAGDLLPESTVDQLIATGYNRLLQTSHEGGVQPQEYLAMYAADRVRNLSAVWLGGTMGCAQCHDHKYDPFTMKDFYALVAIFADIDETSHFTTGGNSLPTLRAPEKKVLARTQRLQLAELEAGIAQLESQLGLLPPTADQRRDELEHGLHQLAAQAAKLRDAKSATMITVSIEPRTTRILPRGNWLDDSGPIVLPAVPEFLGTLPTDGRRTNRLDLANWLTDREAGVGLLTARVFVNRFWYLVFGEGLARNLDDFGGQGKPPTHPQLLDMLAHEFIDRDWDIKHLLRQLVTTRTYRQSSLVDDSQKERDPENRLWSRQSRFRLPAEMIRDTALAISGLLVEGHFGGSIKPYQPAGYYRHLNFPSRKYHQHNDTRQWKRGVYMHWQRQFLHPMLKAFDAPRREECTAWRPRSNTPLAALTLLNDPTFIEAARVFAARLLRTKTTTDERIDLACRLAISRVPNSAEHQILVALLKSQLKRYAVDVDAAKQVIAVGLAPVEEQLEPAELAAWTAVGRAVLNLNEAVTRN